MDSGVNASIFCWGSTANGELGLGGIEQDYVLKPKLLATFPNSSFVQDIACGKYHTIVLLKDGTVYSCGNNDYGQLGREESRKKLQQVTSFASHAAWQSSCGENHTMVVSTNGELFAWGSNTNGQLGLSSKDEQIPVPRIVKSLAVSHKVIQVSCGLQHTLALVETGQLYAWGQNKFGQLGIGRTNTMENTPCLVSTLQSLPILHIAAGGYHSLVISKSGSIFAWGKNSFGQLGIGDTEDRMYPTLIKTLKQQKVKYISCGTDHTAALTNSGGVFTFGAGMYGQLGHGGTGNEVLPRQIIELMGGTVVTQIACGRCHTLAYVPTRGRIYAFGLGGNGQLGTGHIKNLSSPTLVNGPWVHHSKDARLMEKPWYRPISCLSRQFSQIDVTTHEEKCSDEKMDVDDENETLKDNALIIHKIICGGDQSFVISSQQTDLIQPQDFRYLPDDTQISSVQETVLKELSNVPEDGSVPLDHISHIETTFSSVACLNGSFLLQKDLKHFSCTSKNCGVDFDEVNQCFEYIKDAKNLSVHELINGCLKDLLPKFPVSPPECETVRVFLTIPFFHLFQDSSKHLTELVLPLAKAILKLPVTAATVLELWWADLEARYFRNLIMIFSKGVSEILSKTEVVSIATMLERMEEIHSLLQVLKRLNKVNIENNVKVPYQDFYIPKITEVFDVGEDYVKWLNTEDTPRPNVKRVRTMLLGKYFFCDFPFVFDEQAKTIILQKESQRQMDQAISGAVQQTIYSLIVPTFPPSEPFLTLNVRRDKIVEDSVLALSLKSSDDLKKPLKVIFAGEEAVDAGGVRKEFFMLLLREILDPKYGMFKIWSETNCIWFNDQTFEEESMFYLIGMICGLAIYNFTIIDLPFPLAMYKKILAEPLKLEDLGGLSPTMVKSMQDLLDFEGDDFECFCLTFSLNVESFGTIITVELKENGQNIPVTKENRKEYVDLYVNYILTKSIVRTFEAFNAGFHKVCANRVLSLFHAQELMALVIGNEDYKWEELEQTAEYKNEYNGTHPTIVMFWGVFHSLTIQQKKKFLLFLTGSDRIPILGMKAVKIVIQPMNVDDHHLPVAHTCFNILDLPKYSTEQILRDKLLLAIENSQGFGLV